MSFLLSDLLCILYHAIDGLFRPFTLIFTATGDPPELTMLEFPGYRITSSPLGNQRKTLVNSCMLS